MNLFENPFTSSLGMAILIRLAILFGIGAIILIPVASRVPQSMKTELLARYRSWAIIAPIFLISVFGGTIPSLVIFGLIVYRAIQEFSTIAALPRTFRIVLIALIPLSLVIVAVSKELAFIPVLFFVLLLIVAIRSNESHSLKPLMSSLFGATWLIYLMMYVPLLRALPNGELILCLTGTAIALADIGSYICGKLLAKTAIGSRFPIASNISPNKTVLGYFGGFAGVILVVALFSSLLTDFPRWFIVSMIVILPLSAAFGDLTESLVKRFYVVKESSDLIPGHGGILDRLDSFIPAVVAVYFLASFL